MVSITVQLNFDYALSFRFFLLWQPLTDTGARSQLKYNCVAIPLRHDIAAKMVLVMMSKLVPIAFTGMGKLFGFAFVEIFQTVSRLS